MANDKRKPTMFHVFFAAMAAASIVLSLFLGSAFLVAPFLWVATHVAHLIAR